jgi:carnosine N-methyltransferase
MATDDTETAATITNNINHDNDEDDEIKEREHFQNVCSTYRQYGTFAMAQLRGEESRIVALPPGQQCLLPPSLQTGTPEHIERLAAWKDAAIRNQFFFDLILRHHGQPHSQASTTAEASVLLELATDADISKLTSVLKSLIRDWSVEGQLERQQAYGPILEYVRTYLPMNGNVAGATSQPQPSPKKICVPGSGVGRLAFELYCMGHEVQGNDFSLYMLLASDFMLNNGGIITPHSERPINISPYLLESRNCHTFNDRVRSIRVPDVDPAKILESCFGRSDNIAPPEFTTTRKKINSGMLLYHVSFWMHVQT